MAGVACARAGGTVTVTFGGTGLEIFIQSAGCCRSRAEDKCLGLRCRDSGETIRGQIKVDRLATRIEPLRTNNVEDAAGIHRRKLWLSASNVVVANNVAPEGVLLTRVGRVREVHSVKAGSFATGCNSFNGIDLNLWDGSVGQIHECVLDLGARGTFGATCGLVQDGTGGELSTEHIGESQGEECPKACRACGRNHLNIAGRVIATVTGRVVAERTNAGVAVVSAETTIAFASLGTHLVPHLVVRVVV